MKLKVKDLKINEDLYPRVKTSWMVAHQYAQAMKMGNKFPEIIVADVNGEYFIIDGVHRVIACEMAKIDEINAIVKKYKDEKEMFIEAVKLNAPHGKQLSTQDKVKIIYKLKEMGVELEKISEVVRVPIEKIDRFLSRAVKFPDGHVEYLKGPIAKGTVEKGILPDRIEQEKISAHDVLQMIRQLIEALSSGIVIDDKVKEGLIELKYIIDKILE